MEVTLQMFLIVCPLAFLAAFIDSISGGGGLISLPAYYLAGLPPMLAAGSNKFSACIGTAVSTFRFWRGGKILILPALCAVAGAFPGAFAGAEVLKMLSEETVRIIMLVAIPLVTVVMLLKKNAPAQPKPMTKARLLGCFGIGLLCGFYDGFFGPGTGTFLMILFTWAAGMDMVTASGTAKPVNLASGAAAVFSMILSGKVLYALAVPAAVCSIAGNYIGSKMAMRVGAKLIRTVMLVVLVMLIGKLAYEWLIG